MGPLKSQFLKEEKAAPRFYSFMDYIPSSHCQEIVGEICIQSFQVLVAFDPASGSEKCPAYISSPPRVRLA